MPWNYMQLDLTSGVIDPTIGPGSLTRKEAAAEIQNLLDRGADLDDQLAQAATTWARGAKDDTVFAGTFVWTIFEYPNGEDSSFAAMAWLDDFARLAGTSLPTTWVPTTAGRPPAQQESKPTGQPTVLEVGRPYATARLGREGAELRLAPEGAQLVVMMVAPEVHEIAAFRTGKAELAILPADRYLALAYRFVNPKKSRNPAAPQGPGIPWSDTPWQYHLQAAVEQVGVPGQAGQPFYLQLVLVDSASSIIAALRVLTAPVDFADALREAVARQAATPHDPDLANRQIDELEAGTTSAQLAARATARFTVARATGTA